ncbi:MAG: collagen binding domain-containing protein [Polyangiales bacterium]
MVGDPLAMSPKSPMKTTLQSILILSAVLLAPLVSSAQVADRNELGLPGGERVGWIDDGAPDLTIAARGGYGFIAEADGEEGSHQRIEGGLALAVRPISLLSIAAGVRGRLDFHPDDAMGADSSGFGQPWLAARVGGMLGKLSLGLEVRWDLFGAAAPSIDIGSSRLAFRGLVGYRAGDLQLAFNVGYRIDGSDTLLRGQATYRRGDAVSLAANGANAVLLGLAASYSFGTASAFLEATFEPFVGSDALGVSDSPIRVAAGARFSATDALGIQVGLEAALQSREPVDFGALREVEPVVRIFAGLSYSIGLGPDEVVAEDMDAHEPEVVEEPVAVVPHLRGVIAGPDGAMAGAEVSILDVDGNVIATTTTDENGAYDVEVPDGVEGLRVRVVQEGYAPLEANAADSAALTLTALPPTGALRGLVRDFRGRALQATVRVGEEEVQADQDGVFEIELDAGTHAVSIEANGFATQNRNVEVEEGGVTVINVDMRRGRR